MPEVTELRAALRDIADALTNAINNAEPEADSDCHMEAYEYLRPACGLAAKRLIGIADEGLTLAELLPLVDSANEARWTDIDGTDCRVRTGRNPPSERIVREQRGADAKWYVAWQFDVTDFAQPARLVKVSS